MTSFCKTVSENIATKVRQIPLEIQLF